jgi:hypothetical protein
VQLLFISLTRLRLRSLFYIPPFLWYVWLSKKQAEQTRGFVSGKLLLDAPFTFWTLTAWYEEEDMRTYRDSGPDREVMPRLRHWCNEAALPHWKQLGGSLPDWTEAHRRLALEGRLSPVMRPSANHTNKQFSEPRLNPPLEAMMKPH